MCVTRVTAMRHRWRARARRWDASHANSCTECLINTCLKQIYNIFLCLVKKNMDFAGGMNRIFGSSIGFCLRVVKNVNSI